MNWIYHEPKKSELITLELHANCHPPLVIVAVVDVAVLLLVVVTYDSLWLAKKTVVLKLMFPQRNPFPLSSPSCLLFLIALFSSPVMLSHLVKLFHTLSLCFLFSPFFFPLISYHIHLSFPLLPPFPLPSLSSFFLFSTLPCSSIPSFPLHSPLFPSLRSLPYPPPQRHRFSHSFLQLRLHTCVNVWPRDAP